MKAQVLQHLYAILYFLLYASPRPYPNVEHSFFILTISSRVGVYIPTCNRFLSNVYNTGADGIKGVILSGTALILCGGRISTPDWD